MTASTVEQQARSLLAAFAARRPLGAGSFIVTLYGDAIVPRGGRVWLGNVIAVCAEVGISETLVRTAVSRLVSAGHLEGVRDGRRSFYSLTDSSLRAFDAAADVIYGGPRSPDGDCWSLLVLPGSGMEEAARRRLAKDSYGFLGPGLALRAGPAGAEETLPGALQFDARLHGEISRKALADLAAEAWSLAGLADRYQAFCERFAPLEHALSHAGGDAQRTPLALALRLLLVHDYRHLVLDDPALPADLLPADWQGPQAQGLFASLYKRLDAQADRAIDTAFVDASGPLTVDKGILDKRREALDLLLSRGHAAA
ncbi:MAG: PaaX family transcriptional regulator C-terminal domain-containing protein [Kiloniellales bacterium]